MTDLDKMARGLLAQANERLGLRWASGRIRDGDMDAHEREFCNAIRAALLTAPPGYVLVPAELAGRLQACLVAFVSNEGWGIDDINAAIDLGALLAAAPEVK